MYTSQSSALNMVYNMPDVDILITTFALWLDKIDTGYNKYIVALSCIIRPNGKQFHLFWLSLHLEYFIRAKL